MKVVVPVWARLKPDTHLFRSRACEDCVLRMLEKNLPPGMNQRLETKLMKSVLSVASKLSYADSGYDHYKKRIGLLEYFVSGCIKNRHKVFEKTLWLLSYISKKANGVELIREGMECARNIKVRYEGNEMLHMLDNYQELSWLVNKADARQKPVSKSPQDEAD